jgi:hypothetical protein
VFTHIVDEPFRASVQIRRRERDRLAGLIAVSSDHRAT